jgi:hypothetical protein
MTIKHIKQIGKERENSPKNEEISG